MTSPGTGALKMQAVSGRVPRAVGTFVLVLGFVLPCRAADWRPRNVSADGTRFELDVERPRPVRAERDVDGRRFTALRFPGFACDAAPGAPELYVSSRLVAVPPGGSARVQVLQSDIEDLGTLWIVPREFGYAEESDAASGSGAPGGRGGAMAGAAGAIGPTEFMRSDLRYDARAYTAGSATLEPARIAGTGVLRHQNVVELQIRPVLFDPQTGHARLVRRLRIAVDISAPARAFAATGPAVTPAAWQRLYGAALLNAATSTT